MITLNHPYPQVYAEGMCSYGGNQMLAKGSIMKECGCGVVAALDLVLYLRARDTFPRASASPFPLREYNDSLEKLGRRYFPLIPHFGINGLFLVAGLNRLLRAEGLPYRARWMVSGNKIWDRIENMLKRDLPVILSVGPNFPAVWQKHRLNFYHKLHNGTYQKSVAIQAHYVTATGLDAEWLSVSSWGKQFFINRAEYDQYVRKHSNYLFSNIVYLTDR